MKTIDQIEKLSTEDLLRIAGDGNVEVPAELDGRIRSAVFSGTRRRSWILGGIAAAAALLIGVGFAVSHSGPKDTFDDPYLAYAELEKAFDMISDKANMTVQIINNAK